MSTVNYQYITDKNGSPVAVVLPIKEWEKICREKSAAPNNKEKIQKKNKLEAIAKALEEIRDKKLFKNIESPVEWQKRLRNEWE